MAWFQGRETQPSPYLVITTNMRNEIQLHVKLIHISRDIPQWLHKTPHVSNLTNEKALFTH